MKTRPKIYKMATSILLKFLTLKWDISRTISRIEVSDDSFFFFIFHALSFELNFFRPEFLFKMLLEGATKREVQVPGPGTRPVRLVSQGTTNILGQRILKNQTLDSTQHLLPSFSIQQRSTNVPGLQRLNSPLS